jgi:transcriptional regulator with XRE-family HTH domain
MGESHPFHAVKKTAGISDRNIIGARLRQIRRSCRPKVSLEDLAGRVAARGVTLDRSAIGRIENGNRYVLDYELHVLADALRTSVAEFFKPVAILRGGEEWRKGNKTSEPARARGRRG